MLVSKEILRPEELYAHQSNTNDTLTASKPGISQRTNANESEEETTVTTEYLPAEISVLQASKLSDFKKQL